MNKFVTAYSQLFRECLPCILRKDCDVSGATLTEIEEFGGFGGGAFRSREAAGEGRRNHQRGTGQISAKTGKSVVAVPHRRTRRLRILSRTQSVCLNMSSEHE